DDKWSDWEDEQDEQLKCLFCSEQFSHPSPLFDHCRNEHHFDFVAIKDQLGLDFYQCVRLINYIRECVQSSETPVDGRTLTIAAGTDCLENDAYLRPVLENDGLLMCFDDIELDIIEATKRTTLEGYPAPQTPLETELMKQVIDLQHRLSQAQNGAAGAGATMPAGKDPSDYYFQSYAGNGIHESMLKDTVRTEGYRDFMYDNKDIFKGKVVLDVGCGTGILSMFAARAGARQVFAVDNSDIIDKTHQTIIENQLDGVITLIKGKIEEITLPVSHVDIIISEWMGYFLLFEAMLDSVLVARDRWLLPDGLLCPSTTRILLTGFQDEDLLTDTLHFWRNVYGFKMNVMTQGFHDDAPAEVIPCEAVLTTVQCLKNIDISTVETAALDFVTPLRLVVTKAGTFHGFMGYFDTYFTRRPEDEIPADSEDLPVVPNPNTPLGEGNQAIHRFTTGPHGKPTHWKQTLFVLKEPFPVQVGDVITGQFICHKNPQNHRDLDIDIEYSVLPQGSMDSDAKPSSLRKQRFYLR
ncbi:arginine N-methyltransferase, partial [Dimargaris cristalligena]